MNCKHPFRPTLVGLAVLAAASSASAQRAFDYDHPDGLGVRYLLYDRIERAKLGRKEVPELRARFLPKSKSDWIRINGTEIWWGMHVYEFRDEGGFGAFLRERDPRRAFRTFRVEGDPLEVKGRELRYWEYVDTWRPLVEVLGRPQPRGPFRYAVVPELGVRFLADKSMANGDPFPKTDGDNCFARVLPAPSEWVRIDGVPGPVGWMLRVHVFPDLPREGTTSDREHLVDSFEEFVTAADPRLRDYEREFELRGVAVDGEPGHALWRWTDTWKEPKAQETPCFHHVAAVYEIDGREVVLLGFAPADDAKSKHSSCEALETMVASLERWSGKAKDPGFSFYNVAASCRVGDREIGIMVNIPCGPEPKPDRKLLDVAKRMVQSLEPESGDR